MKTSIDTINNMTSRLTVHKTVLEQNGYKGPPHYIGMLNHMYMFCAYDNSYQEHTLMVRNTYDYKYVCNKCNCCVEYVG